MPSFYQARPGGVIQIVEEKAASDVLTDLNRRPDSSEYIEPEEKFINDYIQQNSKRIQSASSTLTSSSLSQEQETKDHQQGTGNQAQARSVRHASAHRLFEVKEWDERQKRLKQKRQTGNSTSNISYDEIKATTQELLKDYEKLVRQSDFENARRREFIYRHYRCNVREPFLMAKFKQFEQINQDRTNRQRFQSGQYDQFLQFINKHKFITQDDYDKKEYDAMAQYDDQSEIHTSHLADPTLLPYHKWMNERRTLSSVETRNGRAKTEDPRRLVSEGGFRSYHRTASPLSDGRTRQSALCWQSHVQTNIDSPIRRLASAKCYHIEQKSQDPTSFDPVDHSMAYLRHRSISASTAFTIRTVPS